MRVCLLLLALAACGKDSVAPVTPPSDPYVVGWVTDSLTPASRIHQSPWWNLYIVVIGADAAHSGLAYQGSLGRPDVDPASRGQRCLGTAGQIVGERQLAYVAIGDTLYSQDSVAYWTLVNRLAQGADSLRIVLDSAQRGDLRVRLPGLVSLTSGVFNPTVSIYGRGATRADAIVRHWNWTDAQITFVEDSTVAGRRCVSP